MNIEITNKRKPRAPEIHRYRNFHFNPENSQRTQLITRET
jgi:hypothetical protein